MGWDRDTAELLPTTKKERKDYFTYGTLPLFLGSERDAYAYYIGSRYLVLSPLCLARTVCALPAGALVTCIAIAVTFFFEESTSTHCRVDNVLPSISTVIGGFYSTNLIWSLAIYLHFLPRLLAATTYFKWFSRSAPPGCLPRFACRFNLLLNLIELFALLSLTYYNSNYNHLYHVISFTIFGTSTLFHMLLHLFLYSSIGKNMSSRGHAYSWRWKRRFFAVSLGTLFSCVYLFYRHNAFCEPYVFSVFAFFEYIFVLSNIGFHYSFCFDFEGKLLYVS